MMKIAALLAVTVAVLGSLSETLADEPVPDFGKGGRRLLRPRGPEGILNNRLGAYLTIEGVRAEGFKTGTRTFLVDTVNGKKLPKPVSIWVQNLDLPPRKRCVLKGYENGKMIGTAPAEAAAAKEQGKRFIPVQANWQWAPYFVVLIVKAPKDLRLPDLRRQKGGSPFDAPRLRGRFQQRLESRGGRRR